MPDFLGMGADHTLFLLQILVTAGVRSFDQNVPNPNTLHFHVVPLLRIWCVKAISVCLTFTNLNSNRAQGSTGFHSEVWLNSYCIIENQSIMQEIHVSQKFTYSTKDH